MTHVSAARRLYLMVEEGHLVRLQTPNMESAAVLFADFQGHHRSVPVVLGVGDYAGALLLSYEAARKAAQALLLIHGYRVPNIEGAHRFTFEAAGWLVSGAAKRAIVDAQYLRAERNNNMYREARVTAQDAQEAHRIIEDLAEHVGPELARLLQS